MGILLPSDAHWLPANWVGFGLFEDCLAQARLSAPLREQLRFCVDAQLDTLDLRDADDAMLAELRAAVAEVMRTSDPLAFHVPAQHPVYLRKLTELSAILDGLLVGSRSSGARDETDDEDEQDVSLRGATFAGGDLVVTEPLFGGGLDRLALGAAARGGASCLVATTFREVERLESLRGDLAIPVAGVFGLAFVGEMDRPADPPGGPWDETCVGVVEWLPAGRCLRRVPGPFDVAAAARLTVGVVETLARAAAAGHLLTGIRPESIWVDTGADGPRVTGLSDRASRLFGRARPVCFGTAPPFEHHYTAPELIRGEPADERTLSFLVGTLLAEWLTGTHPFPDALAFTSAISIARGAHAPLALPEPERALVSRCLQVNRDDRPALVELLAWASARA